MRGFEKRNREADGAEALGPSEDEIGQWHLNWLKLCEIEGGAALDSFGLNQAAEML